MKNNIKYVLLAILIGVLLGKYIFKQYKNTSMEVISENEKYIYLMQIGVYKNKSNMKKINENLKNYFYYQDTDGYHVIIGITKDKNLKDKIVDSYEIKENIYMKRIKINNEVFLESLKQYDALIKNTTDKELILASEKQILSKYEELILNNDV